MCHTDLTLRDWFATFVLAGIVANSSLQRVGGGEPLGPKDLAKAAYLTADAMLAERVECEHEWYDEPQAQTCDKCGSWK